MNLLEWEAIFRVAAIAFMALTGEIIGFMLAYYPFTKIIKDIQEALRVMRDVK